VSYNFPMWSFQKLIEEDYQIRLLAQADDAEQLHMTSSTPKKMPLRR